jgi:hypothetical protein
MKGSFLAVLFAVFAFSLPLYADPGGSPAKASLQSSSIISSDIATVETQATTATGAFDASTVSKFIKSAVTLVAGGVVAVLGGSLLALMLAPLMSHLSMFKRRDRKYELVSIGLAKRTESGFEVRVRPAVKA